MTKGLYYTLGIIFVSLLSLHTSAHSADSLSCADTNPHPSYISLSTNLLYVAAAIPNIGVEFDLGGHWSIGGNWMYAWWKSDAKYRYWRVYGGDVHLQHWFAPKRKSRLFTGHHLGVYGQIVTYDFEWGGRGYLGDRWSYGGGVEYGHSWRVGKRLNIDASLWLGYIGGEYKEYIPQDTHYLWQETKQRNYWGPTQLQISLVWLLDKNPHWKRHHRKGGEP